MKLIRRQNISMIFLIVVIVLLFRILYIDFFQMLIERYGFDISSLFQSFVSNIIVLLLSVVLDVFAVWKLSRTKPYGHNSLLRFVLDICSILFVSIIGALILNFKDLSVNANGHPYFYFIFSVLCVFLFNAFLVSVLDITFYALDVRQRMHQEGIKKRQAEYQYLQLKEQLNPHFLFNSLNMLDYLVQSQETERASLYIKKLAGIYRYFLQASNMELVSIEEELYFVGHYVDLLKVRFPEGFEVNQQIPAEYYQRLIIPCGLQILVENAIKHNVVSKSQPLQIDIFIEDDYIAVTNNIQLKIEIKDSMQVGLNNICTQYKDMLNREVIIEISEELFKVKLPII